MLLLIQQFNNNINNKRVIIIILLIKVMKIIVKRVKKNCLMFACLHWELVFCYSAKNVKLIHEQNRENGQSYSSSTENLFFQMKMIMNETNTGEFKF
jgi:hypothetical protein